MNLHVTFTAVAWLLKYVHGLYDRRRHEPQTSGHRLHLAGEGHLTELGHLPMQGVTDLVQG